MADQVQSKKSGFDLVPDASTFRALRLGVQAEVDAWKEKVWKELANYLKTEQDALVESAVQFAPKSQAALDRLRWDYYCQEFADRLGEKGYSVTVLRVDELHTASAGSSMLLSSDIIPLLRIRL